MKYNHYLKEIGINENEYPFPDSYDMDDPRYQEDEEGFINANFWSLDFTFACYIYSHLCYYRDYCLVAHPAFLTPEKWKDILNKMIKGFRLYITERDNYKETYGMTDKERAKLSKNRQKQINYGFRLFMKYFGCLWY